jgi:basic amino acid/polyamine antiporter, APA family
VQSVGIGDHYDDGRGPVPASPRPLTFWMAVALVMGNMIGSGIFLLPASLASFGGVSIIGWLVSAGGALLLAMVFARLARLDPAAGGPYAFTRRAFGDLPGFLVAWGYWISVWTGMAALAVALVGYLTAFVPHLATARIQAACVAVAAVWVLVGINVVGVRAAGWVQLVTTLLKLLPLALVGIGGLLYFDPSRFTVGDVGLRALSSSVPAAAALTLWAFLGLESATIPADSIQNPEVTIPRATIVGTTLTAAIYIVSTAGVMSVLSAAALSSSTAPYADAAGAVAGNWASRAVAAGAAISCFGALNGWILVSGQLPRAVARDGLFPRIFARTSASGTPVAAMVIGGILASVTVGLNYTRDLVQLFTFLILLATLNTLTPYAFSAMAVFLLPDRAGVRPLTTAAKAGAALAFAFSLWAMAGAGAETVYWGFLLLIAGLPVYVFLRNR